MRAFPSGSGQAKSLRLPSVAVRLLPLIVLVFAPRPASAADDAHVARRAGLRVLQSRHLTLITDRPERADDGVGDLPRLFDEAVAAWCRHYRLDDQRSAAWHATGCLMVDRERFRAAGLLPTDGSVPDFANGFCLADRFWMTDQSNPAYRRHLLFHEGVHALTLTLRQAAVPAWYGEGIAEYLATHRLDVDAAGTARFVATPIPQRPDDVEQLGRIERLQALCRGRAMPGLAEIFSLPPQDHRDLGAYAANWAAVAFLANHPAHREAFRGVELLPLDRNLTHRVETMPDWDGEKAARDFDAFIGDLDYGYDFDRMTVDWSPGRPLAATQAVTVAADRGWQNSGWALTRGQRCSLQAAGRVTLGLASARGGAHRGADPVLESEPHGISLEWYRGRPVGTLLAGQWVTPADGSRAAFRVLAEGAGGTFTAASDGPLYLRVNDGPGRLIDNAGRFTVTLR